MAAVAKVEKTNNRLYHFTETIVGPNAATVYSAELNPVVRPNLLYGSRYISVSAIKSNAMVTDLIVELYGALTSGGTKVLLKTNIITALTNARQAATVDLNANPFPFYYIAVKSSANNSNGDVTLDVFY